MKLNRNIEKIGEVNGRDIVIDLKDLFKYKGDRRLKNEIDRTLARLFILIGVLILFISLWIIVNGEYFSFEEFLNIKKEIFLLPFFSIYFFIYAQYLFRKKEEFDFNTEEKDLTNDLKNIKDKNPIEVENFFQEEILEIIDYIYFQDSENFLYNLSQEILRNLQVRKIIEKRLGINAQEFKETVLNELVKKNQSFEDIFRFLFLKSFSLGLELGVPKINIELFFIVLCKNYWHFALKNLNMGIKEMEGLSLWVSNNLILEDYKSRWKKFSRLKPNKTINRALTVRATPFIDLYSKDLTSELKKEGLVISIGRNKELDELINNLKKSVDASVLIVGEPGVGKTHFIKHLATKMIVEDVPKELKDMRLVSIDLVKLFAFSESVDKFKVNMQSIFNELNNNKVICVLEEIDQIFELREEGKLEVINLISNTINNNSFKFIATSSFENFIKKIKPLRTFSSLFNIIELNEPDESVTFQILMDEVNNLEKEYKILIYISAIKRISEFSSKIMLERSLPDKGIDLLVQSIILAKNRGFSYLDYKLVDELLSQKTDIKIGHIGNYETKFLDNIENLLHRRIIGQDVAISSISKAIRIARAGLKEENKPIASFLFYGPTGVGKTEVAKAVGEIYFGHEKNIIKLDMSEFQEDKNLDRLIGFVDEKGDFIGGKLVDEVRTKPFSLILLDEIEKANTKVLDLFLQILDEAQVTDGMGRKVSFSNCMIIATSNVGSKEIAASVSKGISYKKMQNTLDYVLRSVFKTEFLNRFDKIIMFKALTRIEIEKIVEILLRNLKNNIDLNSNIDIEWDEETIKSLAELGYNPIYGARELKRILKETIEDKIAEGIIYKKIVPGNKIILHGLDIIKIT